jgi:lipoprotein NlpD
VRPVAALSAALLTLACAAPAVARNPARPLEPEARGVVHVVKKGETAWRIARTYDLTADELLRANGLRDAKDLKVGAALLIPGAREKRTVPPPGTPFSPQPPPSARTQTQAPDRAGTPAPVPASTTKPAGPKRLIWPLKGTVYSRYGPRGAEHHDGIDIAAPEGTPIRAAADGRVVFAGEQAGYGSIVILRHAGGFVTVYAHASALLVEEGAQVRAGDAIARVGQTGRTSGPHLHFEVRDGRRPRDPRPLLP